MTPEMILEIWDIRITMDDMKEIIHKYPNLKSDFQKQKMLFGNNMFSNHGFKPTKDFIKN